MTPLTILTSKQLALIESINLGDEYAGNAGEEYAVARELASKHLISPMDAGRLPVWRLTAVGRRVLKESVERAQDV